MSSGKSSKSKEKNKKSNQPVQENALAEHFLKYGVFLTLIAILVFGLIFLPVLKEEVSYRLLPEVERKIVSEDSEYDGEDKIVPVDKNFSIIVPKINANAPVIENVDPFNSQEYQVALTKGVAHAKNTSLPGITGNTFIFAHASDTFYNANRYNSVFYLLNKLELQDKFILVKDGEVFEYRVSEKRIVDADRIDYMSDTEEPTATLMTCWPPGTTIKRLIVVGELDNVSQLQ